MNSQDVSLKLVDEILASASVAAGNQDAMTTVVARALSALERICGKESTYYREAKDASNRPYHFSQSITDVCAILRGFRADLAGGYLLRLQQIHHAEIFGDFVEMAEHLLSNGYKDPAAVVLGGILESHLRALATAGGIPISRSTGEPLKAEQLNQDLAKAGVYLVTEQKAVTAWLALRNHAAHAEWDKYDVEQIKVMHQGILDFLARYPA